MLDTAKQNQHDFSSFGLTLPDGFVFLDAAAAMDCCVLCDAFDVGEFLSPDAVTPDALVRRVSPAPSSTLPEIFPFGRRECDLFPLEDATLPLDEDGA